MTTVLIRFSKRRSSWAPERTDADVQKIEFSDKHGNPDLRPSVYEIALEDLVRAYAEHATNIDPRRGALGLDLGGLAQSIRATPGTSTFAFTREAHREIELGDLRELLELIVDLRAAFGDRSYPVTQDEIVAYAKDRLSKGDDEWRRAVAAAKRGTWVQKLASASG